MTKVQKNSKDPFLSRVRPTFVLKLPYPPTINHYYVNLRSGGKAIGTKGKLFRETVVESLRSIPETNRTLGKEDRIQVWIEVHVPDNRKRDLDNIKKPLLDALSHAGVWPDDCQVDDLRAVRCGVNKEGGFVRVHIGILDA